MITSYATSQIYTITKAQLDVAYTNLVTAQTRLKWCEDDAKATEVDVATLRQEVEARVKEYQVLYDQYQELQKEREDLLVKQATIKADRPKIFGLGAFVGYDVYGHVTIGAGLSANLIRF